VNYRHAFHAGNFADIVKHAALTQCLERMTHGAAPLTVIDTHAGAGAYDLGGAEASRSGEAANGVLRLMADEAAPDAFDILKAAVSRVNEGGAIAHYPGSPVLALAALRAADWLIACELAPPEHAQLKTLIGDDAEILMHDGYDIAPQRTPERGQVLVHIDPPFERGDDYARAVEAAGAVLSRNRQAVILIWLPLKDLETFDAFLRRLEGTVRSPVAIAETRLRPLDDPLRMNGCALVAINPPDGLTLALAEICQWTAQVLGEAGAEARVWNLS
jgi:23S rRNA (adenine2030-N6)-methyltransferase